MDRILACFRLGFADCSQRVGRLAGLADGDNERIGIHQRIAIAEFGAVVDFHRDARKVLNQKFADQGRMPGSPAGDDVNPLDFSENIFGDFGLFEQNLTGIQGDAAGDGFPQAARLLMNFLEHVMTESALLGHFRAPLNFLRGESSSLVRANPG